MTAEWIWAVGPWKQGASRLPSLVNQAGPQVELGSATSRSIRARLTEPSEASVGLNGFAAEAGFVEDLISDLWVWRDGVPVFRGRVMGPTRDTVGLTYQMTVEARDYRGVLDRRLLYADRTWTNVDMSTIAWNLIQDTQALAGGDLGIAQGVGFPSGVVRPSVTFTAGTYVWPAIKALAAMNNGFDFDIDADLAANVYYPQRGADNGVQLDWAGTAAGADRTFDSSAFANAVRQSGADGVTPATATVTDIATAKEGRWDGQYSDTSLETTDMVAQTATANLTRASTVVPGYTFTLAPDSWGGPDHLWLGDYVTGIVTAGRLADVVTSRVYEIGIGLDARNHEQVTVTTGDIRWDSRSLLRGINARLARLAVR